MTDPNADFNATTIDYNLESNERNVAGNVLLNRSSNTIKPNNEGASLADSFGDSVDLVDEKNTHGLRTFDEEKPPAFDPGHDEEMMNVMDNYQAAAEKGFDEDELEISNDVDDVNYGVSYSGDIASVARQRHSNASIKNNNSDGVDTRTASQMTTEGGITRNPTYHLENSCNHTSGALQIDASSGEDAIAPSWFATAKDTATKVTTPTTNNITNDNDGQLCEENDFQKERQHDLDHGQQEQHQLALSSEFTEMKQEISDKVNDKMKRVPELVKELLNELFIYIQSRETIAHEYSRILELEVHESQQLDTVEENASGMLLLVDNDNSKNEGRGSFPKDDDRTTQYQRKRPLSPIAGTNQQNRGNGLDKVVGKENYDSLRRSAS